MSTRANRLKFSTLALLAASSLAAAALSACTEDNHNSGELVQPSINNLERAEVEASLTTWQTLKAEKQNSYVYSRTFSSFFGNFSHRTDIRVDSGKVTKRTFFEDGTTQTWEEVGADVGSQESGQAFLPFTFDDLYQFCLNDVLSVADPAQNFISVDFDENGILSECSYTPKDCQDDCTRGVFGIHGFEFVPEVLGSHELGEPLPTDDFVLEKAELTDDVLFLSTTFENGCGDYNFDLLWDGHFLGASPKQARVTLVYKQGDPCPAIGQSDLRFDLSSILNAGTKQFVLYLVADGQFKTFNIGW